MAKVNDQNIGQKSEMVKLIQKRVGLTEKQVEEVLNAQINVIEEHFQNGADEITAISGMIKLKAAIASARPERMGTLPNSKERVKFSAVSERYVVRAQVLTRLKRSVCAREIKN